MKKTIAVNLNDVNVEEILRKSVTCFSTGAHVVVPKQHIGKKVVLLVLRDANGTNSKARIEISKQS